jgi:hypothetical protein
MLLGLPLLVTRWLHPDFVSNMAHRVAGRSRLAVWQRVGDRLSRLSAGEAQGYLRARAIGIVQEETSRLIEQDGPSVAHLRGSIEEEALAYLVRSITAQVHQQPAGRRAA